MISGIIERKRNIRKKLREPVSCLTHFLGFVLAVPILLSFLFMAEKTGNIWHLVSLSIFGVSLLLLYGASTLYHGLLLTKAQIAVFRKIDHMMIFILIAGTYTPICLVNLHGVWGWSLFGLVWGCAAIGIMLKFFWFGAPRWLSTAIYVFMGWLVLIAFVPLTKAVSTGGILLLVAGGVSYTLGAVIYALKRPALPFKNFGFHEIFHLFVLAGSFFHILFMYFYVL